jgi:glutamate 5-kinase
MATKLSAAGTAAKWGIATVVAGGREPGIIQRVLAGETVGTLFLPGDRAARARKRWLGAAARTAGVVLVDAGAAKAIVGRNASLLPTGVVAVRGAFGRNDVVEIAGPDGRVIARGVTAYDSDEVGRLAGKKTRQIGATLGYCLCDEIVHRSDLVLEGGE